MSKCLKLDSFCKNFYVTPPSSRPVQLKPKPIFLALTNESLLVYDQIPLTIDDWFAPLITYSLLITRKITPAKPDAKSSQSNLKNDPKLAESNYLFVTRHGTMRGTSTHFFRCLNKTEYKTWSSLIDKQTEAAVNIIKHVEFRKSY